MKWTSPERQAPRVFRDDDLLIRFRRSYVEALYEQCPYGLAMTVRDTRGRATSTSQAGSRCGRP